MALKVIVIGLGCVGSAVAATLAKRGVDVIGLEQFEIGHEKGSSAHQSRAFRMAYAEDEGYVPLLKRARELWLALNEDAPKPIFYETGGLYISNASTGLVQDSIAAANAHDVPYELLDKEALQERFPIFEVPDGTIAIFEPNAGMIVPERAIDAYIKIAKDNGANLREHSKVLGWTETDDGVAVETNDGTLYADKLVLAKGAWTSEVPIRPSRQVLTWWSNDVDTSELPVWALQLDGEAWLYGFPEINAVEGPVGFKVAKHFPQETIDPDDDVAKQTRADDAESVRPHLEKWLPATAGACTTTRTCMYGNSEDGYFRIGKLQGHQRVVVIAGLSGHGFKFQPVLGEIGADLILQGTSEFEISFLKLQ